jgi:hypothetical protein
MGLEDWLCALADAGLAPVALYDRYGELDDLPNPLLAFPAAADLEARIADRRFENNLEIWAAKAGPARTQGNRTARPPSARSMRDPPRSWWGYRETATLPREIRRLAWDHFLADLAGRPAPADAWAGRVPPRAFQRLGRLGAVFPDACRSRELKDLLGKPLEASMEPPEWPVPADLRGDADLRARVGTIAGAKGLKPKSADLALARLQAAQRP